MRISLQVLDPHIEDTLLGLVFPSADPDAIEARNFLQRVVSVLEAMVWAAGVDGSFALVSRALLLLEHAVREARNMEDAGSPTASVKEPLLIDFGSGRRAFWVVPEGWEGALVPRYPAVPAKQFATIAGCVLEFAAELYEALGTWKRGDVSRPTFLPLARDLEDRIRGWIVETVQAYLGSLPER